MIVYLKCDIILRLQNPQDYIQEIPDDDNDNHKSNQTDTTGERSEVEVLSNESKNQVSEPEYVDFIDLGKN